jgi:hypothetical protein
LLIAVLKELRGWNTALVAGLIISSSTGFLRLGADQYADVPLSFYFVAVLSLLLLHDLQFPDKSFLFILIGLCAGFCIWTKNEGWLLFISIIFTRLIFQFHTRDFKKSFREWEYFLAGLAPVLLITLYYHSISPQNDMTSSPIKSLTQLTELGRYVTVWNSMNRYFVDIGKWNSTSVVLLLALFGLGMGIRIRKTEQIPIANLGLTILVVIAEYFFTYIMTPRDLPWQIGTSMDRLLLQVFPAILLLFFLMIKMDTPNTSTGEPNLQK